MLFWEKQKIQLTELGEGGHFRAERNFYNGYCRGKECMTITNFRDIKGNSNQKGKWDLFKSRYGACIHSTICHFELCTTRLVAVNQLLVLSLNKDLLAKKIYFPWLIEHKSILLLTTSFPGNLSHHSAIRRRNGTTFRYICSGIASQQKLNTSMSHNLYMYTKTSRETGSWRLQVRKVSCISYRNIWMGICST